MASPPLPQKLPRKKKADPKHLDLLSLPVWQPRQVRDCQQCDLHTSRTSVVLGRGPKTAKVVFVGEAPGFHEDRTGKPFVGDSGKLLEGMMTEAGLDPEQAFFTNSVRCRPVKETVDGPRNGTPKAAHILACRSHLFSELSGTDPRLVVALGATALSALKPGVKLTTVRGALQQVEMLTRSGVRLVPLIATFHPAYGLHDPGKRPLIVNDLRRVAQELGQGRAVPARTTTFVHQTVADVRRLVDQMLAHAGPVAFDTETATPETATPIGALDIRYAEPLCFSFCYEPGVAHIVPLWGHLPLEKWDPRAAGGEPAFQWADVECLWGPGELEEVKDELRRFFTARTPKIGQNVKYDMHVTSRYLGVAVRGVVLDTVVADSLIDENLPHNSEELRLRYTELDLYDQWKQDRKQHPRNSAPYCLAQNQSLWEYAAGDADVTLQAGLRMAQTLRTRSETDMWVFRNLAHPLLLATYRLEQTGILVDRGMLWELQAKYNRWIAEAQQLLQDEGGADFNAGSAQQVARLLFEVRGLPVLARTPEGQPSTAEAVLRELATQHTDPVLRELLRYRKLRRMRDQYLAGADGKGGMLQWLDGQNRIRTTYNVGRVTSGRLSSQDPNLQNVTKKKADVLAEGEDVDPADLAVRSIFCAPPGYVMLEADYSQLELRVSALLWNETSLLEAFARGEVDQHRLTASLVYGVPEDAVTKDQRTAAKGVNFAWQYGGGVNAIVRGTGWEREKAADFLERVRASYPATEEGRRITAAALRQHGYVANVFGRRRHFATYQAAVRSAQERDEVGRRAWREVAAMERTAFNFLTQGAGSDVLTLATATALNDAELRYMGVEFCLTLHDALYAYVPTDRVREAAARIRDIMEGVPQRFAGIAHWRLPVDVTWGQRWGEVAGSLVAA